jgi:hypothetical protein
VLAEIVWLAVSAREQCFTWGASAAPEHIDAAMRYSAVVNYAEAAEIPPFRATQRCP